MAAKAVAAGVRGVPARPWRATGLPVAFGGLAGSGRPHHRVREPGGTATAAPRSPTAASGTGPGGKAVAPSRPYPVPDRTRPPATPPRAGGVTLAPREPDVLSWMAAGAATRRRPGGGPETVERHPRPALRKPGARTRGEAVSAARGAGPLP
ncbi:hypothetical protein [Streptomyces achromogenes]|uniref:helix-turn-helix transcriptional regulator n=1 Tax=Streptomyces achromogenes TaxID=67255 RepID=UPI0037001FE3